MDAEVTIFGQIMPSFTLFGICRLARLFAKAGLQVQVGESSHYTGGQYISVEYATAEMKLERIARKEFIIADCGEDRPGDLVILAEQVNRALSTSQQRHRIEVYGEDEQLLKYLEHRWPLGPESRAT
jgi:hypothetical protein